MALNVLYVSASGTSSGIGSYDNPMDLNTAVRSGGENSVIILLNDAGVIKTSGVALFENQYLIGEGATATVFHTDGVTQQSYTAIGSGGATLQGTSKYNAVVGTHGQTDGVAVVGVTAIGGVNNAGVIAETRYHFILSGQSNMAGWEDARDFDSELQGVQTDVKIWTGTKFEELQPTKNTNPLEFGAAPSRNWAGPELSLGVNLSEALGADIFMTKVTAGGTSINRWLSGDMLNHVFTNSLGASKDIANQGYAPIMAGVAWTQGESDTGNHLDYDQKLLLLLSRMQNEFGISDLNLIVSGVSPHWGGPQLEVEQIQADLASEQISFFSMSPYQGFSNGREHFDAAGYSYMGYQFAVHFLSNLMGNPMTQEDVNGYIPMWLRPRAPIAVDDMVTVIAGYENVTGNILNNDSESNPETFSVSAVAGAPNSVGQWIDLQEGGRIKILANGQYSFEHLNAFDDLAFGESVKINVSYQITDESGLSSNAQVVLNIYGQGTEGVQNAIYGTPNADRLNGSAQNDIIFAYESNDIIYGGLGSEIIFAGAGHDVVYASNNGQTDDANAVHIIYTEDGNDTVYGSKGKDVVDLGLGDNYIQAYGGDDEITSGDGNNNIYAYSSNRLLDQDSTKIIRTGTGRDYIETSASDDNITTGDGDKRIYTYGGNDSVVTGNGNNIIDTSWGSANGAGNNTRVKTGSGNDIIYTDAADDIINAGHGNNNIRSYGGNDYIEAGDGSDFIYARSNNLDSDKGSTKVIKSGNGTDTIETSIGKDTIFAGDGNKRISTNGGGDAVYTGNGNNYIDIGRYRDQDVGLRAEVVSGNGNDTIYTASSNDTIRAGHGSNNIRSYGGNDYIETGDGNDYIYAYSDNRVSDVGSQKTIVSGDGNDYIYTSYGDDRVAVGDGDKQIRTYGGNDVIVAGDGNNFIDTAWNRNSGAGSATSVTSGDGRNTIYTSNTDDTIYTGNGRVFIYS